MNNYFIVGNLLLKTGEIVTHKSIVGNRDRSKPEETMKWIIGLGRPIDVFHENKVRNYIKTKEIEKILDCWTEDLC